MVKTKTETVTFRTNKETKKQLKRIAKLMKASQAQVISIALFELEDLLKTYPEIDYRDDLGGWLLKKGKE